MPTYDIYFDSRDRINGSPWDATFQLTHPLSNVRSVYVRSFQFQNTFQNITSTTNQFEINTLNAPTLVVIPAGMYNATYILQKLNELIAPHGTVSLNGNLLSWNTRYGIKNILVCQLLGIIRLVCQPFCRWPLCLTSRFLPRVYSLPKDRLRVVLVCFQRL